MIGLVGTIQYLLLFYLFIIFCNIFIGFLKILRTSPYGPNFGRGVPDRNRTKTGRIRFLTHFGSKMSDIHLKSENRVKNCLKTYFLEYDSIYVLRTPRCGCQLEVFRTFLESFSKAERICSS